MRYKTQARLQSPRTAVDRSATLLLVLLAGLASLARAEAPPNIVFILADDLGYMDIAANNPQTFYETPHIDRLAAAGMRFTSAYVACPVCSPTRASILTGKYPPRTGITNFIGGHRRGRLLPASFADHLALEEVTIAERLRDAGYATFFAGKWHLGEKEFSPSAQGFGLPLEGSAQFYYPPSDRPTDKQRNPKTTDRIVDAAVDFIGQHADRPFFAYLPLLAVHIPIGASPELVEKYHEKATSEQADRFAPEGKHRARMEQNQPVYAAMIDQMDAGVGRVLDALQEHGVAERTIVIFTSDNGGLSTAEGSPTSNAPLRAGKGWLYEGGIRVPLMIRAPGVKPGNTCETPVISNDFFPTLLNLARVPTTSETPADGVDLAPLLHGENIAPRSLYWHYPHYSNQGGGPGGAIRDSDWKLIDWYDPQRHELFNLHDDPSETKDVAAQNPEKVGELLAKLDAWRRDVGARMPRSESNE